MSDSDFSLSLAAFDKPHTWLVTGAAGFVGSHLVEELLDRDQFVVGLDNFSTGRRENLAEVRGSVGEKKWQRFTLAEGDIRSQEDCRRAVLGIDYVLHQAAFASVVRSFDSPEETHEVNAQGFANVFLAASRERVKSLVYASTSAVYGDDPAPLKTEDQTGKLLSPYAASKAMNEKMAETYSSSCEMQVVGLRYFNVYGPRQAASGPYSAVIPLWISAIQAGRAPVIYGDGSSTRDYCYVQDAVRANLLGALTSLEQGAPTVFNIASGVAVSLSELSSTLREVYCEHIGSRQTLPAPIYFPTREGEILHSRADVKRARRFLSFAHETPLTQGLERVLAWNIPASTPVASVSGS